MSFATVLKTIGKGIVFGAHAAQRFEPLIDKIPGVAGPFDTFLDLIFTLEDLSEKGTAGADRKVALLAIFKLRYRKIDPVRLDPLVDKQLEVLNGLAALVEESEKQ